MSDIVERLTANTHKYPGFQNLNTEAAAEITRLREQVPPGHVRLPDGRDVPVLGTLVETADHHIVGHGAKAFVIRRRSVNGHTERFVGSVTDHCEHFARYFASREKALAAMQEINLNARAATDAIEKNAS